MSSRHEDPLPYLVNATLKIRTVFGSGAVKKNSNICGPLKFEFSESRRSTTNS